MIRQERIALGLLTVSVAFGLGYAMRARAGGIPPTGALSYAGVVQNGSGPLTGSHTIDVSFLTAASGGTTLCSASASVTVTNGYFSVPLPDTCTSAVSGNPNVWVDVTVDGADTGTTKIGAVPYAVEGNHAVSADNATDAGTLGPAIASLQSSVSTLQGSSTSEGSSISTLQSQMTTAQSNITTLQGDVGTIDTGLLARLSAEDVGLTTIAPATHVNGTTTQLSFEASTAVVTADSSGDVTVTYPKAFANGVVSVIAAYGDTPGDSLPVSVVAGDNTTSAFTAHTGAVSGQAVRINYIAIGW